MMCMLGLVLNKLSLSVNWLSNMASKPWFTRGYFFVLTNVKFSIYRDYEQPRERLSRTKGITALTQE